MFIDVLEIAIVLFAGVLAYHVGKRLKINEFLVAGVFGLALGFIPAMEPTSALYYAAVMLAGLNFFNYFKSVKPDFFNIRILGFLLLAAVLCFVAALIHPYGIVPALVLALSLSALEQKAVLSREHAFPIISILAVFLALEFIAPFAIKDIVIRVLVSVGVGIVISLVMLRGLKYFKRVDLMLVLVSFLLVFLLSYYLDGIMIFGVLVLGLAYSKFMFKRKARTSYMLDYLFTHTAPFVVITLALSVKLDAVLHAYALVFLAVIVIIRFVLIRHPRRSLHSVAPLGFVSLGLLLFLFFQSGYLASIGFFTVMYSQVLYAVLQRVL